MLEVHHLFAKGMGGGGRIDMPYNLIGLCGLCHFRLHTGKITRQELLDFVAERENTTPEWITSEIYRLRRLPKDASPSTWQNTTDHLDQRHGVHPDTPQLPPDGGELGLAADEEGWIGFS